MVHLPGVARQWAFQEILSWSSFGIILASLGYVFIGDKIFPKPIYESRRITIRDLYTSSHIVENGTMKQSIETSKSSSTTPSTLK